MLFIGGGGKKTDPTVEAQRHRQATGLGTGSIVAELSMVPNSRLVFHKDGKERASKTI